MSDPPSSIDWRALLDAVRDQRDHHRVDDFEWATPPDDPWAQQVYDRRAALWTAPILWADPILAANQLLEAHDSTATGGSAQVILSFDPRVDAAPQLLDLVARQIILMWETPEAAKAPLGRWCDRMRKGALPSARPRLRVPAALSDGYAVFTAATTFTAAHLPNRRMRFEHVPVFADRDGDGWVMPVPAALWPAPMRDWWAQAPSD